MPDADWLAVCVRKTKIATAVIRKPVPITRIVKTENALWKKGISHCYLCEQDCRKGLLSKIKPYGFTVFMKRYGEDTLLDCLERNEKNGIIYHRDGINGDYDGFDSADDLIEFIKNGSK